MSESDRKTETRLKAEAVFALRKKQDDALVKERQKEREAEAEKTARLRELRIAQKAAEVQSKPELKAKRRAPSGRS